MAVKRRRVGTILGTEFYNDDETISRTSPLKFAQVLPVVTTTQTTNEPARGGDAPANSPDGREGGSGDSGHGPGNSPGGQPSGQTQAAQAPGTTLGAPEKDLFNEPDIADMREASQLGRLSSVPSLPTREKQQPAPPAPDDLDVEMQQSQANNPESAVNQGIQDAETGPASGNNEQGKTPSEANAAARSESASEGQGTGGNASGNAGSGGTSGATGGEGQNGDSSGGGQGGTGTGGGEFHKGSGFVMGPDMMKKGENVKATLKEGEAVLTVAGNRAVRRILGAQAIAQINRDPRKARTILKAG